jgi:diguanylate cyclase (GGDEF)-like protein
MTDTEPPRAAVPATPRLPLPMRLSLVSLVFAAVVATVLTALGGWFLHQQQQDNAVKGAHLAAEELARRSARLVGLGLPLTDIIGFGEQCRAVISGDPKLDRAMVFDAAQAGWFSSADTRPSWPLAQALAETTPGAAQVRTGSDGARYVFSPIRGNGVTLDGWAVVRIDGQAVLQSTLLRIGWLVLAGMLLFAGGLVLQQRVFWRTVGHPLARLVQAADNVHSGDSQALAALPPGDETDDIGRLHAALRRLVQRLQAAQAQLQTQNEGLEATVRERTLLLELANADLERDIQRRQQLEAELREMASTDILTGLANRAFILQHAQRRIEAARRERRPLALMLLDFDHFKLINDTHGHAVGDEVLRTMAQRVRQVCRGSDVVARLGGDEFLLACEGFDSVLQVEQFAQRLVALFDDAVGVGVLRLKVGVSVGVGLFPHHADDFEGVFAAADAAMYGAKQRGGGVAVAPLPASETAAPAQALVQSPQRR